MCTHVYAWPERQLHIPCMYRQKVGKRLVEVVSLMNNKLSYPLAYHTPG